MVGMIVLAAALYVCPGDVYTDRPTEGCKPFQQSGQEGFSTITEVPEAPGSETVPGSSGTTMERRRGGNEPGVNSEVCALYKEYVELEIRTRGGFQVESTDEANRWQTLKRMFQNSPAPNCS